MATAREVVSLRLSGQEKQALEAIQASLSLKTFSEAIRYCIRQTTDPFHQLHSTIAQTRARSSFIGPEEVLVSSELLQSFVSQGISVEPLLAPLSDCFRNHVKHHGFPLPPLPGSVIDVVNDLMLDQDRSASAYLKAVFPSYWEAAKGPRCRMLEDGYVEKVLGYRLGLNKSGETFDIGWRDFYRAVQVQKKVVSFFRPVLAKNIYARFKSSRAWDPSCGFGGRMLGYHAATGGKGMYFGNEPARMTFKDNQSLAASLGSQIRVANIGSEFGHPDIDSGSIDLVFTSPPYFDKERYFDEPTQAWFNRCERKWIDEWVTPTLHHAHNYLRSGGFLVLNVPDLEPWSQVAKAVGFVDPEIKPFAVRSNVMARSKGRTNTDELLLQWRRK